MKFSLMGRRKASSHPLGMEPPIQSLSSGPLAEHQVPFPDKVITCVSGWHLSAPFSSFLADVGRAEWALYPTARVRAALGISVLR